jgi:hypothetical protein
MSIATSRNVKPMGRVAYGLVDGIVFVVIWIGTQVVTKVSVPISVMQKYQQAQYDAYITVMGWMTLVLFIQSILMHRFFGGSLGKLMLGYRTLMANGTVMTWRASAIRAGFMFLIGLMIMAPGPLIAFIFGPGSERASIIALFLGIAFWLVAVLLPKHNPDNTAEPSLLERWCGLRTVSRKALTLTPDTPQS